MVRVLPGTAHPDAQPRGETEKGTTPYHPCYFQKGSQAGGLSVDKGWRRVPLSLEFLGGHRLLFLGASPKAKILHPLRYGLPSS